LTKLFFVAHKKSELFFILLRSGRRIRVCVHVLAFVLLSYSDRRYFFDGVTAIVRDAFYNNSA